MNPPHFHPSSPEDDLGIPSVPRNAGLKNAPANNATAPSGPNVGSSNPRVIVTRVNPDDWNWLKNYRSRRWIVCPHTCPHALPKSDHEDHSFDARFIFPTNSGTGYNDHRRSKSHPYCSPDCPSFNTSFAGRSATFTESVRATILYSRAHHRNFEFNQKDRAWLQKNNGTGNALNDHFVALWKAAPSFPSPLLHSVFSDGAIGPPVGPNWAQPHRRQYQDLPTHLSPTIRPFDRARAEAGEDAMAGPMVEGSDVNSVTGAHSGAVVVASAVAEHLPTAVPPVQSINASITAPLPGEPSPETSFPQELLSPEPPEPFPLCKPSRPFLCKPSLPQETPFYLEPSLPLAKRRKVRHFLAE